MKLMYSWIGLYAKVVSKVAEFEANREGLIDMLEKIGVNNLNDRDSTGDIKLDDIDPFTFLAYLNKYGDDKRIVLLNRLSKEWDLGEEVSDVCGLPTSNAQKVWLFPYKLNRNSNEIERLWQAYHAVMNDTLTNDILHDLSKINSAGWTKITEGLFYLKPTKYLPLNRVVIPYLQSFGINVNNTSYEGIVETCRQVEAVTSKPFHEISYAGWLYVEESKKTPKFWRIGTTENGDSVLNEMLENDIVSIGWSDIGDLKKLPALNKTEIQTKLKNIYEYDNRVASRKANEIINFTKKLSYNDYVVAMDGHRVKAVAKVLDQRYHYVEGLRFPHAKVVEWLNKDVHDLSFSEGSQTTFVPIENPDNINEINKTLKYTSDTLVTANVTKPESGNQMNDIPLNQILYGPPGTGKTYRTINKALSIIKNDSEEELIEEDRGLIKERYQKYVDNGQIIFTTFHQSMSYEDFIEGIKPEKPEAGDEFVKYKVVDGIFKDISNRAALDIIASSRLKLAEKVLSFSEAYDVLIDEIEEAKSQGKEYTFTLRNGGKIKVDGISQSANIHIKHNEDSRSYIVSKTRISKLYNGLVDFENVVNINQTYRDIIGGHNASAYWAVMNVIHEKIKKNQPPNISFENINEEEKQEILQKVKLGDFKNQVGKPYVLIIDEINRGNVSAIFGELITLIEESKRAGKEEALEVTLPYSKQKFSVPSNLYIIGTMNTADRSVEALDTALRRRFSFTEMMPQPELIRTDGALKATNGILEIKEVGEIDLVKVLETINKRIVALLDADHQIGHSYLINVSTLKELVQSFNNCIIPLLKEYFYHDEEKIALVLGEGFVQLENENLVDIFSNVYNIRKPQPKPRFKVDQITEDRIVDALQQLIG